MKLILLLLLSFDLRNSGSGENSDHPVRVVEGQFEHQFYLAGLSRVKCADDRLYFWFSGRAVCCTQGAYSGRLLNGKYEKTNEDGQLLERGYFRDGLKDGMWCSWSGNGSLKEKCVWRCGVRHGKMEVFDQCGSRLYVLRYRHNRLDGGCKWFKDGVEVDRCFFSKGKEQTDKLRLPWLSR